MEMLALSPLPLEVISGSAERLFLLLAEEADERLWVLVVRNWTLLAELSLEEVRCRGSMRARRCNEAAEILTLEGLGGVPQIGICSAQ
jgi:hypothetical protein